MRQVSYEIRGQVAVLTLHNPPVNGLGHGVRSGLLDALDQALADPQVAALVVTGGGQVFSGGADVKEFGSPKASAAPTLPTVVQAVENAGKPVVAAIAGHCLGGGLELALACHYRVFHQDAVLGLPEVKLGLLPGAGGTQRLPRLLGLEEALNWIVSGDTQRAQAYAGTALVDLVVEADVLEAAVGFANRLVDEKKGPRRASEMRVHAPAAEAYLQFARNTVRATSKHLPAPAQCVEAVAASVGKSFDEGLKVERAAFLTLMNSPESRALRHVFMAERVASKLEGLPADTPVRDIRKVGLIGAGTMGGGIAMAFVNAGLPVVILETSQAALDKGLATIRGNYESTVKKGKLSAAQFEQRMAALTPTLSYSDLADCDLIIEAVFESMEVKQQVFEALDAVAKPGAILASNTSALDLNRIAQFTKRPQDVVGLHFFSPANLMRLLEVVRGAKTAPDVMATSMALAKRIKKIAVVSGVCDGFIGNRMLARYGAAANDLLNRGALPHEVDRALENFGFAMGIFRVGDLAGLDIGWAGRKRRALENPDVDFRVVADRICEAGRFGQKTGAGWYRYEPGQRKALQDPVVTQIIADWRKERGLTSHVVFEQDIVDRCIFALVNEGARILADGIAQRASDIDVVYLNGYGFPKHRGGPMQYADEVGLANVVRALRRFALESPQDAAYWTPAPLLLRLADEGKTFN